MGASTNQSVVQNKLRALATGIPTVPLADPWVLNGTGYSKAQLVQLLQASITATDAASAAKATAAQAVASAKAQRKQALMLRALVLKLLELQLGDVSPVLTQLGFTTAPRAPSVAVKSAALDKSKATRAARHTMGPKQKAAIKGVVVATTAPSAVPATTVKSGS